MAARHPTQQPRKSSASQYATMTGTVNVNAATSTIPSVSEFGEYRSMNQPPANAAAGIPANSISPAVIFPATATARSSRSSRYTKAPMIASYARVAADVHR